MSAIAGYTFGTEQAASSHLTLNDLELLKQTKKGQKTTIFKEA